MTEPSQTTELVDVIRAAKIARLIWIDDKFGYRNASRVARAIRTRIEVVRSLSPNEPLNHPKLATIPSGAAPEAIEENVLKELQADKTDQLSQELLDSLDAQITQLDSEYKKNVKDLSTSQFAEVEAAFRKAGTKVETLSLNDWLEKGSQIRESLTDGDLIFLDQDFSSEEGGTETSGEDILATLLNEPRQEFTCIFFTHALSRADESKQRTKIAERIGLAKKQHRFAVISKESLTAEDAGYGMLTVAFKDAFLRDWCFSIAQRSMETVQEAFEETGTALLNINIEELAAAFFQKAFSDGTLEPDVFLRVLFLAARVKLQDRRHSEGRLWQRLASIRAVLAAAPQKPLTDAKSPILKSWRDRELFDPEDVINKNFSPVFLGDVFEVKRGNSFDWYVLVAQPCDLIIRDAGERNNTEALFLKISDRKPKADGFAYHFEFPEMGSQWIQYAKSVPINLNLLDIVSFREDGKLLFDDTVKCVERMLPGIRKKLEQFTRSFSALFKTDGTRTGNGLAAKYQRIAISGFLGGEIKVAGKALELPIRRVGRIRSPYAEAILGGFAMHHTRVAFDYDFSDLSAFIDHGGESKNNEPAQKEP